MSPHHVIMLCILKTISVAILAWYSLPWFLVEAPREICITWQVGLRFRAVVGTVGLCSSAIFFLAAIIVFWRLGEKNIEGRGVYKLQHWNLLLSTGPLYLFLLLLPESELIWRAFSRKIPIDFIFGWMICSAAILRDWKLWTTEDRKSVYGLQHGRLHLEVHVPMWMNMGYWKTNEKDASRTKDLAEACRDLLDLVLAEAELSMNSAKTQSRRLIDVGFGCGDQTIHLMSNEPLRRCDELWWDAQDHQVYFDHYIGITKDRSQYQYAQGHVTELRSKWTACNGRTIALFCANAARPELWDEDLLTAINTPKLESQETWLLALDTAYHFSPSRWILIDHARWNLDASFMTFDLCLSPNITILQKLLLRTLTALMGAPWENFVTPDAYKQRLIGIGYPANAIKVVDISEHVFLPLSAYMEEQNRRLRTIGLGLGNFQAAKWLFRWWGSTGVVRGVVVVAKHPDHQS